MARTGQFASQEGTELDGKQAASKSTPIRTQWAARSSPFLVPVLALSLLFPSKKKSSAFIFNHFCLSLKSIWYSLGSSG